MLRGKNADPDTNVFYFFKQLIDSRYSPGTIQYYGDVDFAGKGAPSARPLAFPFEAALASGPPSNGAFGYKLRVAPAPDN